VVPDLPEDGEEGDGMEQDEDMDEVVARAAAVHASAAAAELRRRSQCVQRAMPRPPAESSGPAPAGTANAAEAMIAAELGMVLEHDAAKYPVGKSGKRAREAGAYTRPFSRST